MRSLTCGLITTGFLLSSVSFAQKLLSRATESYYNKAMTEINPKHISWVKTTAAGQKQDFSTGSIQQQAAAYGKTFDFSTAEIEYLVSLVMILVSKDNKDELKKMLDNMEKLNQQKKQLNDALTKVNSHRKAGKELSRPVYDSLRRLTLTESNMTTRPTVPDTVKKINSIVVQVPPKVSPSEMDQLKIQLQQKLGPLNELTQKTAARVHVLNDKISRLNEHISTAMRKLGSNQDSIIQNLK